MIALSLWAVLPPHTLRIDIYVDSIWWWLFEIFASVFFSLHLVENFNTVLRHYVYNIHLKPSCHTIYTIHTLTQLQYMQCFYIIHVIKSNMNPFKWYESRKNRSGHCVVCEIILKLIIATSIHIYWRHFNLKVFIRWKNFNGKRNRNRTKK